MNDNSNNINDAIVDVNSGKIKKVKDENGEWWELHGECNRCGECCNRKLVPEFNDNWECNLMRDTNGASHSALYKESVDGKTVYGCKLQFVKPWQCVMYPRDPHEKLFPSCSYSWEKL